MNRKISIVILTVSVITLGFVGKIAADNDLKISNQDSALGSNNRPFNYFFYTSVFYNDCNNNSKSLVSKGCTDNNSCQSLKYSECSEGFCKCLSGYTKSNDKCLANLGSKCSSDSDCAGRNSVCPSGTCQCPKTNYFEDGSCHEYAERPGYQVYSAKACQYLQRTTFFMGFCVCDKFSVEIDQTCRSLLGFNCTEDSDCALEESVCSSGVCRCNSDYHEHRGSCYGFPGAECKTESNCISGSYICQTGICKVVTKNKSDDNNKCENATGRECWIRFDQNRNIGDKFVGVVNSDGPHYVCRETSSSIFPEEYPEYHHSISCNFEESGSSLKKFNVLADNSDMAWKNYYDYNLSLAVLQSLVNNQPSLICRTRAKDGLYYMGAVKPPNYNECHYQIGSRNLPSNPKNFQVLEYINSEDDIFFG